MLGAQAFSFDGLNGLTDPTLPQLAGKDFTVQFDLDTTEQETSAQAIDLLGYRVACNAGNFFDVRLGPSASEVKVNGSLVAPGHLLVEFGDGPMLTSTVALNDGEWHEVDIVRTGTTLTLSVDGVVQSSLTLPAGDDVTNTAAWQVANGDPCVGHDQTQPLSGAMANIYVGPSSGAPNPVTAFPAPTL